jgi:hypothetical protein
MKVKGKMLRNDGSFTMMRRQQTHGIFIFIIIEELYRWRP